MDASVWDIAAGVAIGGVPFLAAFYSTLLGHRGDSERSWMFGLIAAAAYIVLILGGLDESVWR